MVVLLYLSVLLVVLAIAGGLMFMISEQRHASNEQRIAALESLEDSEDER